MRRRNAAAMAVCVALSVAVVGCARAPKACETFLGEVVPAVSSAAAPRGSLQLPVAASWARTASSHYKRLAENTGAVAKETSDDKLKQMLTEYQSNANDTAKLMNSFAESVTSVAASKADAYRKDLVEAKSKEISVLRQINKHCAELAGAAPVVAIRRSDED